MQYASNPQWASGGSLVIISTRRHRVGEGAFLPMAIGRCDKRRPLPARVIMDPFKSDRPGTGSVLDRWEIEMWMILAPLTAALKTAHWTTTPEAALATSDQLRAIARDSTRWLLNHHCPMPDLAISFTRLLRSSVALANALEEPSRNRNTVDWRAVTREVSGFQKSIERFVTMMNECSARLQSDPT